MRWITSTDGVRLAVREDGNADGPTLIAIHGYPDDQTLWNGLVGELGDRYRVVTYDVRGAGESDKPRARESYRLEQLVEDFAVVARDTAPGRRVHLLAHDWGSIQAWHAVTDPRRAGEIASLTSISGPCLEHVGEWMRLRWRHPSPRRLAELFGQAALSSYIGFFRIPRVPEWAWRHGIPSRLIQALELLDRGNADRLSRPRLADAVSGLELYRANMPPAQRHPAARAATMPVQIVVPTGDPFVSPALQVDVGRWVTDVRIRRVRGGHWVPRTKPELVARHTSELIDDVESGWPGGDTAGPAVNRPT